MQNTRVRKLFSTILGVGAVAGSLVLSSCEDEFTEEDAIKAQQETLAALDKQDFEQEMDAQKYRDSLERIGPVINYTVTVVAGGSVNTNARTSGEAFAEGATVTVVQGGSTFTATTGAGGVATFSDLRIGEAVVTVEAEDHTMVTYTTSMGNANYEIQEDNVETTIPIFPTTLAGGASEVSGTAWAELDLTNDEPEFAVGATVRASISVSDALSAYGVPFGSSSKGEIRTASYSDFVQTAEVDANGQYTLIIPNGNADSGDGIDAKIEFLPYEADQKYLAQQGDSLAVVTEKVIFNPSAGGAIGSHVDSDLHSVYVQIGAPTGTASGMELIAEATRQSFTSNSEVLISTRGTGYTNGDRFTFSADEDGIAAFLTVSVDGDGAITSVSVDNNGATYDSAPTLTQDDAATGTGASLAVNFSTMYDIKLVNGGSGYWEVPEIVTSYEYYDNGVLTQDAYDDNLSANVVGGKIQDTNSDGVVETIWSASMPKINILPLEARQAVVDLDDYFVNDEGRIEGDDDKLYIYFDGDDADAGEGYVTSPTVTFKSAMGESNATGVAYVEDGEIEYITITNPGSGYMKNINDFTYSLTNQASQSGTKTFKTSSSNTNYNFDFGTGVLK